MSSSLCCMALRLPPCCISPPLAENTSPQSPAAPLSLVAPGDRTMLMDFWQTMCIHSLKSHPWSRFPKFWIQFRTPGHLSLQIQELWQHFFVISVDLALNTASLPGWVCSPCCCVRSSLRRKSCRMLFLSISLLPVFHRYSPSAVPKVGRYNFCPSRINCNRSLINDI